jgi:D-proline reductase (dithiol) PrdB
MKRGERIDPADYAGRYEKWIDLISANHHATNPRVVETQQFTPLRRSLSDAKVALVSSAGVHLDDQPPFHVETVAGDPSYRLIPDEVDLTRLRFTHTHYDTAPARADSNVVFPLDRIHEAVETGRVGSTASVHIGMMGFNPDPTPIVEETAPAVAEVLIGEEVDVVVLVPG